MKYMFYVIGVGGTGSLLARDLPKLLTDTRNRMCLVDGDMVEKKNIVRQGYQRQDVGDNKAVALSRKINSLYDTNCIFMDQYINNENLINLMKSYKAYTPCFFDTV